MANTGAQQQTMRPAEDIVQRILTSFLGNNDGDSNLEIYTESFIEEIGRTLSHEHTDFNLNDGSFIDYIQSLNLEIPDGNVHDDDDDSDDDEAFNDSSSYLTSLANTVLFYLNDESRYPVEEMSDMTRKLVYTFRCFVYLINRQELLFPDDYINFHYNNNDDESLNIYDELPFIDFHSVDGVYDNPDNNTIVFNNELMDLIISFAHFTHFDDLLQITSYDFNSELNYYVSGDFIDYPLTYEDNLDNFNDYHKYTNGYVWNNNYTRHPDFTHFSIDMTRDEAKELYYSEENIGLLRLEQDEDF